MLVPPVAPGGTGSRQVGDAGARGSQNPIQGTATTLWPLAPAQTTSLSGNQQTHATPPLAATPAPSHNQGINRYELYSLFPGSGGGSYVATAPGTPAVTPARTYHATTHKERTVSESVFSAAVGVGVGGYTWGAPTPPPGSPYSPVPGVTQLELLAKNLANLTPHHTQQPLSLQGVGVNVGASLHHAQHTQHTLNLAGLHHLHHGESMVTSTSTTAFTSKFINERTFTLGGLHQGTFSPQLSLVTAGTPTLTINSFSSPNTPASVVPSNGLLVQEYQSAVPSPIAVCPSSTSGSSSIPTGAAACTVSTVIVQGAQTGSTFVQSTTKKRESFVTTQAQTSIKVENKTTRQSCVCKSTNASSGKTKVVHSEAGCSRTLPVVSSWNGQDTSSCANALNNASTATNLVKREPLAAVPCQVAEVSTSLHATTTAVKIEPLPPKSENGIVVSTAAANGIPVGIAVARQRLQHHQETSSTSMRNVSLSHHTSHHASYHHFQPDNLGSTTAMAMGGATLVHCTGSGDERPAHLAIPSGALAPSINATLNSGLNNIGPSAPGTWPPTLWQYPTTAMPALEPVGFPQLGVGLQGGLQLVRDPSTGHLLLIHAAAEQMQQAVVWPNYPNPSGPNISAPPLLLPGPTTPPSLQLLSDINGARLVLTDNKRKQPNNIPIVKIEADCTPPTTTIIASTESNKALQTVTTMTGSLVTDAPLLTALHYYPHAPALVQISQSESTQCKTQKSTFISKATSPVSCLTPPPDVTPTHAIEGLDNTGLGVQDASNQTDTPETEEDHHHNDGLVKHEQIFSSCQQQVVTHCTNFDVVSSTVEKPRIVNSSNCDTEIIEKIASVNKIDKSSVVMIKESLKTEVVSTVDQETEKDKEKEEDDEAESISIDDIAEERIRRRGSRVIEITEENCDSFHENLEFFGRRRNPIEQLKKPHYTDEALNEEMMIEKIRREESTCEDDNLNDTHVDKDHYQSVSSTLQSLDHTEDNEINKLDEVASSSGELLQCTEQADSSSSPYEKSKDEPLVSVKSLDMPSIDCDDEIDGTNVIVKREVSNNFATCAIETDNVKSLPEKLSRNDNKKFCNEKYHAGIENVVEKLKKNAAALQDNSIAQKLSGEREQAQVVSIQRSVGRCLPRTTSNGLKKHILRFCETTSSTETSGNSGEQEKDNNVLKKDSSSLSIWSTINNNVCSSTNSNNNDNNSNNSNNNNCINTDKLSQTVDPIILSEKTSKNFVTSKNANEVNTESDNVRFRSKFFKNNQTCGKPKSSVDLSGLELLSNSIAQFEHLKQDNTDNNTSNSDIECSPKKDKVQGQQTESNNNNVDSPLGLLCALAEQRFMEEVGDDVPKRSASFENSEEISCAGVLLMNLGKERGKVEKRRHSVDDNTYRSIKRTRKELFHAFKNDSPNIDTLKVKKSKYSDENEAADDADDDYTDSEGDNRSSPVFDIHKIEGNKGGDSVDKKNNLSDKNSKNDKNWSKIKAMEMDMRERLADIQKKYKEKQKELSKLPLRKDDKKVCSRQKKFNSDCEQSVEEADVPIKSLHGSDDDIPSALSLNVLPMPRGNVNLIKLAEPRSHIKLLDSIPSISLPVTSVTSPIITSPISKIISEDEDNKNSAAMDYDTSSSAPTIASSSSAKKRKVGRPRKLMCSSMSARHLTETIVAKKSRSKSSLVSYLLNSKNRHYPNKLNGKSGHASLPIKCGLTSPKGMTKSHKMNKAKVKPIKQTPLHNKNVISSIIAEKAKLSQEAKLEKQVMKLKPKFKAENKVRDWNDDEENEWNYDMQGTTVVNDSIIDESSKKDESLDDNKLSQVQATQLLRVDEDYLEVRELEKYEKSKKKKRKSTSSSPLRRKSGEHDKKESKRRKSSDCKECKECAKVAKAERAESITNRCKLTSAHLSIDQLRVLTAMGGLFYAGRLNAIQPPDVYAITLDGERGNRPHIHSREEILRDAIVEVCPGSTKELPPGTRLCAYWSQQYRCLYPGTSVEPSDPDSELDEKFVSVEFDDGDSGRIALDDIRLLQPDYPVVEYDPNPLLSLGKKRRQTSVSTDDKRASCDGLPCSKSEFTADVSTVSANYPDNEKADNEQNLLGLDGKALDEYRERKKLKKRRRDKLKRLQQVQEGKKKHKRHKCCEEHRKHKHRKHRKHKHKHSHHSSHNESSHVSGGESCSGLKSEEEGENEGSTMSEELSANKSTLKMPTEPVIPPQIVHKDPVSVEKIEKPKKPDKKSKTRERQESVESRSKMAAFLPARQLWGWAGKGYRRPGAKGRAKKQFFKAIQRGNETIQIGDSAVFLSTGRPDRPYIGKIESMWETTSSNMIVKVKWFYHPEETVGCPANLKYPGALFESPHMDENDVQTISHKCEVLPLQDYTTKLGKEPHRYLTIYDNNDIYYLAGYYDPTTYLLTLQPGVV
ncbi:uncharacterized protein wge isoform X2 [Chelonus insularis]|uniref:uncharacterized protein wge isoform X2 n=1 Tax=Chelonus insularis TaxID=460826 RepID=UPI0015882AFB|nr:uncharacterized protein LOC118068266 isoform X2 [Chelonus insularis]